MNNKSPFMDKAILQEFYKHRRILFLLLFLTYIGYYLCRAHIPVVITSIRDIYGYEKIEMGAIFSAYTTIYAIGKLVNGFLGDRIGSRIMLIIGITGSVGCNIIFGFGDELQFFIIIWSINAFFQSSGWVSLVSGMSQWYAYNERGKYMGFISLTYLIGDFLARALAGFLITRMMWSGVMWVHAGLFLLIGIVVILLYRSSPVKLGLPDVDEYSDYVDASHGKSIKSNRKTETFEEQREKYFVYVKEMIKNKWFWVVCFISLCLTVVRIIFWNWSVDYIEDKGSDIGLAAYISASFPLLGILGTIFAGWISDRMEARRGPVIAIMSAFMVVAIYIFSQLSTESPVILALSLGFVGFMLYGPYTLLAGALAIDFGHKYSAATAAGIIDAVGYAGSAIFSGIGMGYLIDEFGWDEAFLIVVGIAALSTVVSFSMWKYKPDLRKEV